MGYGAPKLLFVAALAVNCILWSHSRYGQVYSVRTQPVALAKRSLLDVVYVNGTYPEVLGGKGEDDDTCFPITVPVKDQCAHIIDSCPDTRTFLSIPYLKSYFCTDVSLRSLLFSAYIVWLVFLFSTLGISASDFFCPNLATLAQLLGLDENMAGVTFLAFGNGSPDVFATFSAMKANSGGLAIGELLGAATFVVSCVAGSLCIIKPFKVMPYRFFRDVGFFTVAVTILLVVLWDSELEAWEAAALIALYLLYVAVVVGGSFWEKRMERRRRHEELMRDEFREEAIIHAPYHDEEPYRDEPSPIPTASSTLQVPTPRRARAISHPGPPRLGLQTELPQRPQTRSPSPQSSPHISTMPSFSLVGALEFRRIVSSLQQEAAGSTLNVFDTPSPYPGGHYHYHSRSRSRSRTPGSEVQDPWDAALGVPLNERSPPQVIALPPESTEEGPPIPVISHTPASPVVSETDTDVQSQRYAQPSRRQWVKRVLGHAFHLIFPTLHGFRTKPFMGKIAAVLAAPAVMFLTLTLPVVVTAYNDVGREREKHHDRGVIDIGDSRLVDFEEEGIERTLIAEEEVAEEMHELKFNKWLMAVQCTLGPLFSAAILFDGTTHEPWLLLATGVAGFTVGILVLVFSDKGSHPTALLARCIMGFMVAVVWIMAIADEVVEVLTTFGFIFGLSDAIIGLTIFAVGNSLADLVANMSVAVFAPIMGFSACFGGPMLNILLGIGISGSYIIRQTAEPYYLHFSTTLVVTGCGLLALLLATLVFVPLNGYFLPRGWGVALIIAYTLIMITNIIVEVKSKS
ncbi:Sodium/calcium exchanger protein-domain-containing protein [Rhodofomes roseus]|uniref:Sodium/calcium exchanger protein-domain-containing protein n=1 Tax=Rhodofomes roseus TaxID=34475 RepID=A0A4Y9YBT9_9APHY|nr:Sodium/calcium exchanger protein-domain-containing protein [Rhodofomes roseus]KAH9838235.1 Sodium/calcium exchanger protein-domain-containing protein [Rhodofomes roseus]TFY59490.1 hypothetical protein EVJ58_g5742 [Rhodofomes roseus]